MTGPRKQISLFVDIPKYQLLRQAAARSRQPMTQYVLDMIDWKQVSREAQAAADDDPEEAAA